MNRGYGLFPPATEATTPSTFLHSGPCKTGLTSTSAATGSPACKARCKANSICGYYSIGRACHLFTAASGCPDTRANNGSLGAGIDYRLRTFRLAGRTGEDPAGYWHNSGTNWSSYPATSWGFATTIDFFSHYDGKAAAESTRYPYMCISHVGTTATTTTVPATTITTTTTTTTDTTTTDTTTLTTTIAATVAPTEKITAAEGATSGYSVTSGRKIRRGAPCYFCCCCDRWAFVVRARHFRCSTLHPRTFENTRTADAPSPALHATLRAVSPGWPYAGWPMLFSSLLRRKRTVRHKQTPAAAPRAPVLPLSQRNIIPC